MSFNLSYNDSNNNNYRNVNIDIDNNFDKIVIEEDFLNKNIDRFYEKMYQIKCERDSFISCIDVFNNYILFNFSSLSKN
jgi:hypothetical protein